MRFISNDSGFFPNTDAKKFEIILIAGFVLTFIILIINFGFTLWFFKFSNSLFIIEIVLLALNVLSIILTIILRVWRNNRSIFDTNLWSSIVVVIFNLVIVIINFLLSIVEEVLFSFVFEYISYSIAKSAKDYWKTLSPEDLEKMNENYHRIMDKLENAKDVKDSLKKDLKKNTLRILPWIAFNFNILVQFIMFIIIIILMGRIKRQSDFGFPQNDSNLTSKNGKLGKRSSSNLDNLENNLDSTQKNLGKKRHKKKSHSKKKGIRVNNQY